MSWLRLDDQMHRHEKIAPLSDRAWRLHITALLECCAKLTDGHVAGDLPKTWPAAPRGKTLSKTIAELEAKGLWEPNNSGWLIHDFLDWNPSAAKVRATREVRANAGKLGGKRSGKTRAKPKQTTKQLLEQTLSKDESKSNPVPVPVPDPEDPPIPPRGVSELDLATRSRLYRQGKLDAQTIAIQFGEPVRWPEVRAVHHRFGELFAPIDVSVSHDSRVACVLDWFAASRTVDEVCETLTLAAADKTFWSKQPLPSILKDLGRLDALRQRAITGAPETSLGEYEQKLLYEAKKGEHGERAREQAHAGTLNLDKLKAYILEKNRRVLGEQHDHR